LDSVGIKGAANCYTSNTTMPTLKERLVGRKKIGRLNECGGTLEKITMGKGREMTGRETGTNDIYHEEEKN
jgi:hypothetical protein